MLDDHIFYSLNLSDRLGFDITRRNLLKITVE